MINPTQASQLLKLFPVLKSLSEDSRRHIFEAGQILDLPQGQMLLQPNQQCQYIPLVLSGQLRVFKLSANGREMTLFRTGPGETCLMSIACRIKDEDFPAQAQVEEAATLFMLPQNIYHLILDQSPAWKDYLIITLYEHLTETMETLEAVAFDRTDRRLAAWLLDHSNGGKNRISTTHETIAVELGTVREVISRLLGEFKSQNAVRLGRGRIDILSAAFLRNLLDR
ncbi:MAG TPA: transcriptional regulator [Clostridiales bacterium]|nr:transcriptional regulator [Clostridiales bacterium]